ncbi:MAG TPA: lysylphosphatidylglycerol synthase transmembrane domain-containing protein, partial [Blastocatellia bacterium]|nr:lysylphosphatidylglycerol synthase transmembrane domain-containing protein [Blastocatellia bacterium]
AGLIWVLHDFRLADLPSQMARLKWPFVVAAMLCDVLGYVCQAWRWQLLLKSFGAITVGRTTQALCAGLFVSEVLPMSLGELARSYLAARWMQARFANVFPTVLVERLFDGVWIAAGVGLTAMFLPLPESYLILGDVFGALVLFGTGALIWFLLRHPYELASTRPAPGKVRRFFQQLAEGLYSIGLRRDVYLSFAVSLLFLLLQALTLWLMLWSYGLQLSFWMAAAVLMLVLIGTATPGPPGNVGTWQLSCVLGLTLFGVDKTVATGFSLVCYALLSLLLIVIGFLSLSRSGTTLFQLRHAASELQTG